VHVRYGCVGSFLDTFPPSEIVLPFTLENGGLHTVLSNSDHSLIRFIKRQHYNDNKGKEMIRHIATTESSSVELEVGDSYLALAAFHALLKYTQFGKWLSAQFPTNYGKQSLVGKGRKM